MKKPRALNAKQMLFIDEYMRDQNALQAATRAGYTKEGAGAQGHFLLKNQLISAEIKKRTAILHQKAGITAEKILQEFANIGFCDISQAYDENGCVKPLREIPENVRRCIAAIETEDIWTGRKDSRTWIGTIKRIKWWDKTKALEMLGKQQQMFADRIDINIKVDLANRLQESRKRVAQALQVMPAEVIKEETNGSIAA